MGSKEQSTELVHATGCFNLHCCELSVLQAIRCRCADNLRRNMMWNFVAGLSLL